MIEIEFLEVIQFAARELGVLSIDAALREFPEGSSIRELLREDMIQFDSGPNHPWKHAYSAWEIPESERFKTAGDVVALVSFKRAEAMRAMVQLLADYYDMDDGKLTENWRLVFLKGCFMEETITVSPAKLIRKCAMAGLAESPAYEREDCPLVVGWIDASFYLKPWVEPSHVVAGKE